MTAAPNWARDPIELLGRQYSLGIEWDDIGCHKVDLDLQAVIVDRRGNIVDAVYFNNLEAVGGGIGLQGDALDGETEPQGLDEVIWISLSKLPEDIEVVIFVVAAYNNRSLKEVDNGKVVLLETVNAERKRIGKFRIENSCADADVVGMIRRTKENSWVFVEIDLPAECGSHFLDILEPNIGDIIRAHIPHAPKRQNVSFQMVKGSVVHFQGLHALKRLSISLDADVAEDATEAVDIDITAVFYSEDFQCLGAVDSVNEEMFGVGHSGELHYEHHEHIQESLAIDLLQMPDKVKHIFILLTIQHGSFEWVRNVHMHIADQDAQDLATMDVQAGHKESALAVARIFDTNSRLTKRWALHSHVKFFGHGGTTWHTDQCKKELLHLLHEDAGLQRHSSHSGHGHGHHEKHAHDNEKHTHETTTTQQPSKHAPGTKVQESPTKHEAKKASKPKTPAKKTNSGSKKDKTGKISSGAVIAPRKIETVPPELTPEATPPPVLSPGPEERVDAPASPPASKEIGTPKTLRKKGGLRVQAKASEKPAPVPAVEQAEVNVSKDEPSDPITTCETVPVACADETEPQKQDGCSGCSWSERLWCRR